MNTICPRCQHANPTGSVACMACGEPLNQPPLLPVPARQEESGPGSKNGPRIYICVMGVLAVGSLVYRLLGRHNLDQSAALFLGLPALMGILLALTPKPVSNTGIILRMMTLGLLLSGPVLGEGFICILFSAPLFLGVGLIVGLVTDALARKRKKAAADSGGKLHLIIPLPLLLLASLEGTSPQLSFPREETVSVTRTIAATAAGVESALQREPRFQLKPPGVLGIGFPVPLSASRSDLKLGSRSEVHFSGGEGRPPGDLVLEVAERREGYVRFAAISDTSHITHWLRWSGSEVRWKETAPGTSEVTWTIHFERRLDPAWYFGLPERWVVKRCADYLLTTCATP